LKHGRLTGLGGKGGSIMLIHSDLSAEAVVTYRDATWRPSPESGVDRLMLERIGGEKVRRATSIVTYRPGSRFSEHIHDGGEEILVLDGVFSDITGDFGAGSYIRNPVGSRHAPWSENGATIFVKLAQFDPADQEMVRLDTNNAAWLDGPVEGVVAMPLHRFRTELVKLVRLAPRTRLPEIANPGGAEIFVVRGAVQSTGGGSFEDRDWLRLPPGSPITLGSGGGATLYVKTGHLAAPTAGSQGETHTP
jgi:quercetin dioxygenase-like cupin family protein